MPSCFVEGGVGGARAVPRPTGPEDSQGSRGPASTSEVAGWQERVQRHTVEQIIAAPMIDVPVPLMEEQLLVDVFAPHDIQVPEQVIEVPKILIDELSARTLVREPQLAEQLVEVPTIISAWWSAPSSRFCPRTGFNSASL